MPTLGIVKYMKSLVPHIERDQILEDLRLTETELENIVLPAYADAATFFSQDKFKSKENGDINEQVTMGLKSTRMGRQTTFLGEFNVRLNQIFKNIAVLNKHIGSEIGRDVVTDGVSSRKVALIRIAEKFSYISRYSLDLLNLVYINESSAVGTDVRELSMSPAEMGKARASIPNLIRLLAAYGIDPKDFEKNLGKMPDVVLGRDKNQEVEGVYGDNELDPMTPQLTTGFAGNPIYHVRMLVAEWQTKRYKANQEKKKVLELRLLHLQLQRDSGENNPKLVKEISYTQDRVAKIDRYLKEVEADLDVEVA